MQCEVVAVRMAAGRNMMIVGRRDRRRMGVYEARADSGGINCCYRIELIVCAGLLIDPSVLSKVHEVTDAGVIVGQRLCGE